MTELRISLVDADGRADVRAMDSLRGELGRRVGRTEFAEGQAAQGAKGALQDLTTLVVGVLGSGAAVALVNVLKAYVEQGRTKIIVEWEHRKISIETGDIRKASAQVDAIARALQGQ
jgi:hypothetical protein